MEPSAPRNPDRAPGSTLRDRAAGIVATATVLALLYLGRDVLVPVTLAVILSLAVAPLIRLLRRVGLGQTLSVLAGVLALTLGVAAATAAIGVQMVRMTAGLPQYEATIRHKLATLSEMTVGRLQVLAGQAERTVSQETAPVPRGESTPAAPAPEGRGAVTGAAMRGVPVPVAMAAPAASPIPVAVYDPPSNSLAVLQKVVGSIWVPLETAGIVLVVLVFVLLEHEAVRDRFIRVAGGTDIRATTLAINDAGERLSRFFVSQFRVNFGVACTVWLGLSLVGLPHALLWGAMSGVLRFVPYVGVWIAALFATLLAAAVDPGWTLAILTLGLFTIVELIAGQLIEPQLYGHATGLSPLSVVVAAIFWSWLWGPIGLIVSTPLTLCLVVAGRHIKALSVLDILLGDNQALTMPQRFYQRALSGDSQEIIAAARLFLKRSSFAAYCDVVLMPALSLARLDMTIGAITAGQQAKVREVMIAVIGALGGQGRRFTGRRPRGTVLDDSTAGRHLRAQRERISGPYQGPLAVPPGSVMLCVGLGSTADDLATELLVRILRDQKVDARHLSIEDLIAPPPPDASRDSVAVVYLVSAFPSDERQRGESVAATVRQRFPGVRLVTVFLPGMLLQHEPATDTIRDADKAATSFGHAVQICLDLQQQRAGTDDARPPH
jgi:predicted PurR-regulated permease PerM